ncbi:capping complex subunit for YIEGIA [Paenibacillus flagellatus]|uniref:Uncharacterized protein n=1 Tax=Paenibacillus flagellatus TaxID=2211139 RepID=A0A2V5K6D7_9BACL|nr:hypothetical protein [Paenibacillus flagellatus]PYI54955.1 hypothetical protein DLM86_10430 [Paenibacillus flagellatus]
MGKILAVVSTNRERVGGGAPIFIVETEEERQDVAFLLEKILDASAHDLKNGSMILVDHKES